VSEFGHRLGETLTKTLMSEMLSEVSTIKKVVAVYPGRFQPAGVHHAKTYKWVHKKFKDTWVVTSNKTDGVKSPLNFKEKKMVWLKHGVKNIIQAREPYKPKELLNKYDPKTTAVVFVYGAKEGERLKTTKADGSPAYYQYYEENKKNLKGYEEHGYVIVAPHISIKVLGGEVDGTRIRKLLGSPEYDKMTKIQAFEDLFGWYDEKIFKYLTKKFGTLFENAEIIEEFMREYPKLEDTVKTFPKLLKEISTISAMGKAMVDDGPAGYYPGKSYEGHTNKRATQLGYDVLDFIVGKNGVGRNADYRLWGDYAGPVPAVSFFAAGDQGKKSPTNQVDIDNTRHAHNEWTKFIEGVAETVGYKIVDFLGTNKAIRRRIEHGHEELAGTHTLSAKAHMTTNEPGNDEIEAGVEGHSVKESVESIINAYVDLITEGGAKGHMSHPFDDNELTFGDLKEMIRRALTGNLHIEGNITEKLDGQALSFSWKNNKVIFARNKGQLANDGAEAPDVKTLTAMFSDRPENIRDAFVNAAQDLQSAISGLSDKQKDKMFKEGQRFMAVEVMTPKTQNVIPQNQEMLVFHGLSAYDEKGVETNLDRDGNDISSVLKGSARMLAGMIKQINADVQDRFEIHPPVIVSLPKSKDFEKSQSVYFGKLDKLKKEFNLKDSDQLMMYHQSWWENFIIKSAKKFKVSLTNVVKDGLIKRWAFFDKGYRIPDIRKDLADEPKFLEWVLKYDKGDHSKQAKENLLKLEIIFLRLGGEVMQNVSGFLAAGGKEDIAKDFQRTSKELAKSSDIKVLNKYRLEMGRLDAIGGLDAIVPSEGIVFEFKGGIYKLTGAFAPINQLNGIVPGRF
jgi:hypothetical protein